jgi:uncharacterized protein (TIGR00369 family)
MADTPAFNPATAGWEIYAEKGLIDLVGPLWERRKDGIWQLGLFAEERHVNTRGVVHGGALLTLLDQALGVAGWVVNGGVPQATVQLDVQFVAAVQPGEFIEAEGRVVRQTRSLLFMQGTCTVGARVVATASGI